MTEKPVKADTDYSYRKFQELFDGVKSELWEAKEIINFTQAWEEVKKVYQTFIYWFENGTLYHYIGFLIDSGVSIKHIFKECSGKNKSEVPSILRGMISKTFKGIDISELSYKVPKEKLQLRTALLLFNIETCVLQQKEENSYYKFPFDLYKNYKWDIEHIDSQTENPLSDVRDKIVWLSFVDNLDCCDEIKQNSLNLKSELEEKRKDVGNKFEEIYKSVISSVKNTEKKSSELDNDDSIENLTLLDAGTNRGYGNALFPTKRKTVIEKEYKGVFIPPCTKNLFLKYYTKNDNEASQWKNTWTATDKQSYYKAIIKTIGYLVNN